MKKLVTVVFVVGLFFWFVVTTQAEKPVQTELREIMPWGCFLDGSDPSLPGNNIVIDMNMNGMMDVPLVAEWSPAEQGDGTKYGGDAKFGVFDVQIGENAPLVHLTVDIDLTRDDSELSEAEKENLFIYTCEGTSDPICTANLVNVKAAIKEKIAEDNEVDVIDITFGGTEKATFLGVFVKGMDPHSSKTGNAKRQNYILTEVCNMYLTPLAEASTTE